MIPLKLRLSNFMCYRDEQTLDFSGIHLACLAGDNGHGKSALLDAITWALWGRARARRDDELIALGEVEMWVEFEFGLGPQRYRVWRQRSKKGRGQSDLHFYIWNPTPGIEPSGGLGVRPAEASTPDDSGDWQLLDDGGLVERQAQIIRTLRLDYETFVNSAFLLQGRADSFTVKTASERKQILADILGLGRYDLYEERAKQEVQARKEQATRIGGEIAGIDAELSRRADYEARLQAARAAAAQGAAVLRTAEVEQAEARLRRAGAPCAGPPARRSARPAGPCGARPESMAAGSSIRPKCGWRSSMRCWRSGRRSRPAGPRSAQRAPQMPSGTPACSVTPRRANASTGRGWPWIRPGWRWRPRIAGCPTVRPSSVAGSQRVRSRPMRWRQAQAILAHMAEQQARRDAIAAELREIGERAAALRSENDRIKADGQALNEKVEMLQAADTAACPLCRQPLTRDHRDRMLADLAEEHDALAERYRANGSEGKALSERKAALDAEDALLAHDLRARDARQRQAAQAEAADSRRPGRGR